MNRVEQFDHVLRCCGFPPLQSPTAYHAIGSGAWHDAYLATLRDGTQLVIRMRKQVIYGREEPFDAQALQEDYAPVGIYYAQANSCQAGICPAIYTYHIEPGLSCTIESYMGQPIALAALTSSAAFAHGQQLGAFFRAMHAIPPSVAGFGPLRWRDGSVIGQEHGDLDAIWQAEVVRTHEQLAQLLASELQFDRGIIKRIVVDALDHRSFAAEPVALVNRDVTPENMLRRSDGGAALVDPVPVLHNPTRYASFFCFCYRFLLPALSESPRYMRHQFRRHAPILAVIADGYVDGYTHGDPALKQALTMEYALWLFRTIYGNYQLLNAEISEEQRLRTGGKAAIATSLSIGLRELEHVRLD